MFPLDTAPTPVFGGRHKTTAVLGSSFQRWKESSETKREVFVDEEDNNEIGEGQHQQAPQQQQVKQPCQPPPVKCQETCAPKTKDPCAPRAKKQCPPKGTANPGQQKCPPAQQAPQCKQK
uniref:small proline-rich protein 4 n=1 Tax=Jaculus jaculus TaxID=51337 RepID=UPI001E1B3B0F|nr:small proline-rich protein 4 [Jaculus jaculus]